MIIRKLILLIFIFTSSNLYAAWFSKDKIERLLTLEVIKKKRLFGKIVNVKIPKFPERIFLPSNNIYFDIKLNFKRSLGNFSFPVRIFVDKKLICSFWAKLTIAQMISVVIAKENIKRGEIITKDKITLERKIISRSLRDIAVDLEDVLGKEAKKYIKKGEIIKLCYLKMPYMIKKGEKVDLIYSSDSLFVKTIGLAKKSGYKGEIIPVINIDSKKIIYGKVIKPGVVLVNYQ